MKWAQLIEAFEKDLTKSGYKKQIDWFKQGAQGETIEFIRKGSKKIIPGHKFVKQMELDREDPDLTFLNEPHQIAVQAVTEIVAYTLVQEINRAVKMGLGEQYGVKIPAQIEWEYSKRTKTINLLTSAYTQVEKTKELHDRIIIDEKQLNNMFIFAMIGWNDRHLNNRSVKDQKEYYFFDPGYSFGDSEGDPKDAKYNVNRALQLLQKNKLNKETKKLAIESLIFWQHFLKSNVPQLVTLASKKIKELERASRKNFNFERKLVASFITKQSADLLKMVNKALKTLNK